MINVTIWNEYLQEKCLEEAARIYPDGIHTCIGEFLSKRPDLNVRTAVFEEPEHGLTEEVLDNTDVLIFWSHKAQDAFSDEIAERVRDAVLRGMGLIVLHSAHNSKVMKLLMGTSMTLKWRHDDRERLFVTEPSHPIARNLPEMFELPKEEMYGEYFDIPKPDDVVFTGWFAGGEVFRSGCTFRRGMGKIFYFQPGHETCPTYYDRNVRQIITNAVYWCEPVRMLRLNPECREIKIPPEAAYHKKIQEPGPDDCARGAAENPCGSDAWKKSYSAEQDLEEMEDVRADREAGKGLWEPDIFILPKPGGHGMEFADENEEAEDIWDEYESASKRWKKEREDRLNSRKAESENGMALSVFYEHVQEAALQTGRPVQDILKEIRAAGICAVELDFTEFLTHPETAGMIREAGLKISSFHQNFDFGKKYAAGMHLGRKMIDTAKRLGVEHVMIVPGFLEPEEGRELNQKSGSYDETAAYLEGLSVVRSMREALVELTEYAAERGIRVSVEDFDSYTSPVARLNPIKWFMEQIPGLEHTLDTGNYAFSNEDARDAFEVLKEYVGHVHCKDRGEEAESEAEIREALGLSGDEALTHRKGMKPVPVGDGYLPIAELVESLKKEGYRGYLAIEHFGAPDQLEYMLKSAAFLRDLLV